MNTTNLSLSQYFISLMYLIKSQDLAPPSETKKRWGPVFYLAICKQREGIFPSLFLRHWAYCCASTYHTTAEQVETLWRAQTQLLLETAGHMKEVEIFSSPLKRVKNQMAFRFGGLVFLMLSMAIILTSGLPNQGSAAVNRPESLFQSLFLWASALLCFYDCLVMIAVHRNFEVKLDLNQK